MLPGQPQMRTQRCGVDLHRVDRGGELAPEPGREPADPTFRLVNGVLSRVGVDVVETLPERQLDLVLVFDRDLRDHVPGPVDQTALT